MSIRLQLAVLALVAVCLPLAAVVGSGLVMFGMHDDAKFIAVVVGSTLCAIAGALLLGRRILGPLDELRAASKRLAGGDLSARASESGPRELHELGAAFNEMAANLEHLFDARRELVAWASHDLRTPLASLRAMVEALEDGLAEPAEYLPAIRAQTNLLSDLVEDLFELARIDSGVLALELREASLGALVAACLSRSGLPRAHAECGSNRASTRATRWSRSPPTRCSASCSTWSRTRSATRVAKARSR